MKYILSEFIKEHPVFMAPMTGVTDFPFRKILSSFTSIPSYSEMVASREIIYSNDKVKKKLYRNKNSSLFIIQIVGNEPYLMSEAAKHCEQLGADIIDINMGCPSKKVTGKLSGSALMRNIIEANEIIKSVVNSVKLPVTLKMRLGWDENNLNAPKIAKSAEDNGVKLITIHGRTRCQFYKDNANWKEVSKVKNNVFLPIIVNGDICDINSANNALEDSLADGVMIGRGAIGRPWILQEILSKINGSINYDKISKFDQYKIVIQHYEEMLSHYGYELGVRVARKHLNKYFYYQKEIPKKLINLVIRSDCPKFVKTNLKSIYLN
ncbi:MAG: putative tRNA-dihydrouridine synthase [Alphaproteobacteria bacterium MarineAlpha2_Bin1]|nr:MAG: putative tRNA-dihydrouridine synthase [Alphaproteobacteria bacterium MarineAlpha2_Bin1]|tara:strand:- start:1037 stop:2005 length:969 start_codon:yes stop_codon:yes gene_type:complete